MTSHVERYRGLTRTVIAMVIIAFIASCTAFEPTGTTDPAELRTKIAVGEEVRITRQDGSRPVFVVTNIDDAGIHGDGISVAYDDIDKVQVKDISVTESTMLGLGVLVVVIVAALSSIDEDDIFESSQR